MCDLRKMLERVFTGRKTHPGGSARVGVKKESEKI